MLDLFFQTINGLVLDSGFVQVSAGQLLMLVVSCVLIYLAICKGYEPLLLIPIAFGMLLANLPGAGLSSYDEGGLI